jgi:aspartate/glutamate racemase
LIDNETEGRAQFWFQQLNQARFPTDIIVGNVEHFDFSRIAVTETVADETVALACTEIPLLISDAESPPPILDSTRILARAALRQAIMDERS